MLTLKSSTENGTPANTLTWHTMMRPCLGDTWSTLSIVKHVPDFQRHEVCLEQELQNVCHAFKY